MIGVIARPDQAAVVEEFFQLFKTPWEVYRKGTIYDVVLATKDADVTPSAPLTIISGPDTKASDPGRGINISTCLSGTLLNFAGVRLPIYTNTAIFGQTAGEMLGLADGQNSAALRFRVGRASVIRLGYDIFQEAHFLLTTGQPPEWATSPTLELHFRLLRDWILGSGIHFLEIPPIPAGHAFFVCLTHDIDFVGIERHKFDHTMWGFFVRATLGTLIRFLRHRATWRQLIKNWLAAISLPLVYVGWVKDFWVPFEWYMRAEAGLPSTYFLIPFKHRIGGRVSGSRPKRRAAAYDITDVIDWSRKLIEKGCEIGVHGIDAWWDSQMGRAEMERIKRVTDSPGIGIRMHWLLLERDSSQHLQEAGYQYDSTFGYNEAVGFRAGTPQAFRPLGAGNLLELPITIQDGALFFPKRLGLTEEEAWKSCLKLINNAEEYGGVITIIWHDRSPHPERLWGDFYIRLINEMKARHARFGTASEIVEWFKSRRSVSFNVMPPTFGCSLINLTYAGRGIIPPLRIKTYHPSDSKERLEATNVEKPAELVISWAGESPLDIELPCGLNTDPVRADTS
jgi:hypothetical protein